MPETKKQLVSLQRRQQMLYIGMFSLVTVMVWVAVNLFQSQKTTQISPELKKKALPLTPSINQQVIQQIEEKRGFSEEELANFPIYKLILNREGGEDFVTIDTPETNLRQTPAPRATATPLPLPEPEAQSTEGAEGPVTEPTEPAVEELTTPTEESSTNPETPAETAPQPEV
jgi:hypothetical protein